MIKVHSAITNGSTVGATVDSIDVAMQNFSEIRGRCHLILQVFDEAIMKYPIFPGHTYIYVCIPFSIIVLLVCLFR